MNKARPHLESVRRGARAYRGWLMAALAIAAAFALSWYFYPTDRTPKGAYYRVVAAVNRGEVEAIFPYIETQAQHAAFTIQGYQEKSYQLVDAHYPEPRRSAELERLGPLARAEPGPGLFALYAEKYGWVDQLRRDLSGVARVVVSNERASVETVRGTRYPFRRRDNGIWGLTLFTARLVADAEKAARDYSVIEQAAEDYQRASSRTAK